MKFATTFTRCRDGKPLMGLDGQPFNGLEIRPDALRRLGETLMWLADLGEALPTEGRYWKATSVELDIGPTQENDGADTADFAVDLVGQFTRAFNKTNQG